MYIDILFAELKDEMRDKKYSSPMPRSTDSFWKQNNDKR